MALLKERTRRTGRKGKAITKKYTSRRSKVIDKRYDNRAVLAFKEYLSAKIERKKYTFNSSGYKILTRTMNFYKGYFPAKWISTIK